MKCKNPFELHKPHLKKVYTSGIPEGVTYSFLVPCGKCLYCRLQRRKEWTLRLLHENDEHEHSCFTTLTYKDDELPITATNIPTLRHTDLTKFWKRLRKQLRPNQHIKYYACGEYGEQEQRPHYHAIIFGLGNMGQQFFDETWTHGQTKTGTVTPDSIRYVAQYIDKKVFGKNAQNHYNGRQPEFQRQSKGIGEKYLDRNPHILWDDYIPHNGKQIRLPRYYQKRLYKELNETQKALYDFKKRYQTKIQQSDATLNILGYGGKPYSELKPEEKLRVLESQIQDARQMDLNLKAQGKISQQRKTPKL